MTDRQARLDTFLGRMAVERRLITDARLREALAEQGRDPAGPGRSTRPLGTILVARGWITDAQLVALLEEQQSRISDLKSFQREDRRLGKILIHRGVAPDALIQQCLREQAEMIEEGRKGVPRLGELLIMNGYATADDVRQALAAQKKMILACVGCHRRYNIAGYDATKSYRCPSCQSVLAVPSTLDDVRVDKTATGLPPMN